MAEKRTLEKDLKNMSLDGDITKWLTLNGVEDGA